jgi:hypothetical protein
MNVFHFFMQGAAQAAIDAGEPLIDEALSMTIDDGMIYMIRYPEASADHARAAGAYRITHPEQYDREYYP